MKGNKLQEENKKRREREEGVWKERREDGHKEQNVERICFFFLVM